MPGADRRLHPLTLLFELGAGIRRVALPLIAFLFLSRARADEGELVVSAVALAVTTIAAIARYLSLSYRYEAGELVVRSGIFVRRVRHIPYDRIQNLDAVQKLGHRLLGVVTIQVQTGSGAEPEATLSVLPLADLAEMRERVFARRPAPSSTQPSGWRTAAGLDSPAGRTVDEVAEPPVKPAAETLLALPTRELLLAGFIENRGLVLILGVAGLLTQVDVLAEAAADWIAAWVPGVARGDFALSRIRGGRALFLIGAAVAALLVFVRLMSTVWAAIRLHDYRLVRSGDDLRMEYGLLTRVSATISIRRIQTIAIRETALHRRFGRAAVQVTTAGSIAGGVGGTAHEWLAPIIPRSRLPMLLALLHPGLSLETISWRGPHPNAFGRMARGGMIMPVVVAGLSWFLVAEWAILVGAVLAARAIARAYGWARYMGWSTLAAGVIFRGGWLRRTTTLTGFARVQAVAIKESPLDRRAGMADIIIDTAAGQLASHYFAREDALALRDLVAARSAETEFAW